MWHFRTGFSLSVHVSFKMKSGIRILPYVIFVRIKWTNRKESWIKPNGERIRNPKLPTEDLSLSTTMISLLHNENILKERSRLPVSSIACSWRNFVNKTFIFDTQNALVVLHLENRIPTQTPLRQLEKDWRDSKWQLHLASLLATLKPLCYFDFKQNVWTKWYIFCADTHFNAPQRSVGFSLWAPMMMWQFIKQFWRSVVSVTVQLVLLQLLLTLQEIYFWTIVSPANWDLFLLENLNRGMVSAQLWINLAIYRQLGILHK